MHTFGGENWQILHFHMEERQMSGEWGEKLLHALQA